MPPTPSFIAILAGLEAGDGAVATTLYDRFAAQLLNLAAARLNHVIRLKAEPEDVAQSVFKSFFQRQRDGQFELDGWDAVWRVLVVITLRKCANRAEYHTAARRDVRRELPTGSDSLSRLGPVLADPSPPPEDAAQLAETVERLLDRFRDAERGVVELALQGLSAAEVSERLGCSQRKVYRVLERVRSELELMAAET